MYRWLGQKSGYCPQIWLSNKINQTGWINYYSDDPEYNKMILIRENEALFQFEDEYILGRPKLLNVSMLYWEMLMVFGIMDVGKITDSKIVDMVNERVAELEGDEECNSGRDSFRIGYLKLKNLIDTKGIDSALNETLFSYKDQVVLPELDLSKCTKVFYNSESDKIRLLAKFPEDKVFYKRRWYKY